MGKQKKDSEKNVKKFIKAGMRKREEEVSTDFMEEDDDGVEFDKLFDIPWRDSSLTDILAHAWTSLVKACVLSPRENPDAAGPTERELHLTACFALGLYLAWRMDVDENKRYVIMTVAAGKLSGMAGIEQYKEDEDKKVRKLASIIERPMLPAEMNRFRRALEFYMSDGIVNRRTYEYVSGDLKDLEERMVRMCDILSGSR